MRTLNPTEVARDALAHHAMGLLCAQNRNAGTGKAVAFYHHDEHPTISCAIGVSLTPAERIQSQAFIGYRIAHQIGQGLYNAANPEHTRQLAQLQELHDNWASGPITAEQRKLREATFLEYARALAA